MKKLSEVEFRNEFVSNFPGDETGNLIPRQTRNVLYSKALPTPVKKVTLVAWSDELAKDLHLQKPGTQNEIDILGGNHVTSTMYPYAACYAGHQFGNWAGQLGDGRAITLGEITSTSGESWELQLKGAGMTPYSRNADGRAVLRSSIREYLMSEAMHFLNVPTTRALSLVTTGEDVLRDMFYNGHPAFEPGAIVLRASPSFLRFGNFEILASRNELVNLKSLVEWTISHHYPHIKGENKVLDWYKEVVERTASLMVEWLRVGFVHGVMNTDNMSILGLTIDYGPYSFIDNYDPEFTPNTTDLPGRRYAFARQASVAKWNLSCLAGAISPLFESTTELEAILDSYDDYFWSKYYFMMTNKSGLDQIRSQADVELVNSIDNFLKKAQPDYTIFYQLLSELDRSEDQQAVILDHFRPSLYRDLNSEDEKQLSDLIRRYLLRLNENKISREDSLRKMSLANPRFILRNYLLHEAIEAMEKGDHGLFKRLERAMKDPYSKAHDEFFTLRPEWAGSKAGCSMLSCSS